MIDDDSAVAGGGEPATSASPRAPNSDRPVARDRRTKVHKLIERLVAERRVRITGPHDDEVAEWRRVVNYAKRHGLEPAGKRIEKVPHGGPGLKLFLADGPHPNARSQRPKEGGGSVPVPSRLGNLHPIVTALKDDERRLVMPSALRRAYNLLRMFGRDGRPIPLGAAFAEYGCTRLRQANRQRLTGGDVPPSHHRVIQAGQEITYRTLSS
ncbi:hypothetical protein [Streptomyces sp. EN23]|uniref:hypothetical protein n=1 Tax=Streptomyces sp. EN23 TaxID=212774 RepID=UPI00114C87B1|nr:hypothetical protein [Streptomyces sp. EN23]